MGMREPSISKSLRSRGWQPRPHSRRGTPAPVCALMACLVSICLLSRAVGAGETEPPVRIRFAKTTQSSQADVGTNVADFQRHVVPLLGRLGCNGRSCHGSFQGRGGFVLSLFGYDFAADHAALTGPSQSEPGNRVNRQRPNESLILTKPTGQMDHEGGRRFEIDSWQYRLLHRWIEAGAKTSRSSAVLESLQVTPSVLEWQLSDDSDEQPNRIQLQVNAVWSDGSREDVTDLARFRANDDAVAEVDELGIVKPVHPGDTHIVVFYDNGIQAIPVVIRSAQQAEVTWPDDPVPNRIDELVNQKLRSLGIVPSPICSDAEFLRRASIDLTGTLPTPQEVSAFLADRSDEKRLRKIDELLRRPAFAAWWATKLCDFTGCNPQQQAELGQETAEQWYMWIYQRLLTNTPYDQIVEGILLATSREAAESYSDYAQEMSGFLEEGSREYFSGRRTMPHFWSRQSVQDPEQKALAVAHSFLGIRLQCAQCHKHPWDQWTQEDFEQFSKFFEPVKFGVPDSSRDDYLQIATAVGLRPKGDQGVRLTDAQVALARKGKSLPWREVYIDASSDAVSLELLRSGTIEVDGGSDPRVVIMDWMRDPGNPWFARAIVNRVWASCFHIGIVDPSDDLNAANPPSNAALLDWLSREFVNQGYDLRWLLREITRSATWQRSCLPNETNLNDRRHFSRAIPRRLPAEVVYDGIKQAVCGEDEHETVRGDLSRRAIGHLSMRMSGTYAMHVFGKPSRSVACDCDRVNEPSLLQSVFLQNDPLLHLLLDNGSWLRDLDQIPDPKPVQLAAWIDEAWLRVLSRPVTDAERARAMSHLQQADSHGEGMEDLVWSLINTKEFLLNH